MAHDLEGRGALLAGRLVRRVVSEGALGLHSLIPRRVEKRESSAAREDDILGLHAHYLGRRRELEVAALIDHVLEALVLAESCHVLRPIECVAALLLWQWIGHVQVVAEQVSGLLIAPLLPASVFLEEVHGRRML